MGSMSTRTAVVTGASSGIGAATARHLAREGYTVVCAARRADRIEALAAEIGGRAVVCDVTSPASVAALAEAVGPRLDVLVNNAGGAIGLGAVAEADPDQWRRMYDVNVLGLMQVTQALLPALVASGAGTIVNVGSTAGRIAYEGGAGYTAAKHGTKVVTETLRLELFDQPVRVCEVAPAWCGPRSSRSSASTATRSGPTRSTPGSPSRSSPRTSPMRSPGSSRVHRTSTSTSW